MTERDPLGDLEKSLFEAARRERPSDDVRSRTRAAVRTAGAGPVARSRRPEPARRGGRRGVVLALAAVVALGVAFVVRARQAPVLDLSPEVASAPVPAPAPALPPVKPPVSEPSVPAASVSRAVRPAASGLPAKAARAAASASPPAPAATLSDEVATLDRARTALVAGDAAQALRVLDEYDHVLHGTALTAEATLLRVEALARSGQAARASKLARRLIESNPGSPLAERARKFAGVGN